MTRLRRFPIVLLILLIMLASEGPATAEPTDLPKGPKADVTIVVTDRFDDHGNRLLRATFGVSNTSSQPVPITISASYSAVLTPAPPGAAETNVPWLAVAHKSGAQLWFVGTAPPDSTGVATLDLSLVQSQDSPSFQVTLIGANPIRTDATLILSCPPTAVTFKRREVLMEVAGDDSAVRVSPAKWSSGADSTILDFGIPQSELSTVASDIVSVRYFAPIKHRNLPSMMMAILLAVSAGTTAVAIYCLRKLSRRPTAEDWGGQP